MAVKEKVLPFLLVFHLMSMGVFVTELLKGVLSILYLTSKAGTKQK